MYKKYITRKGKKTGPYYYESVRLKNGKIKTIYLGKTPDKEKLAKKLMRFKVEIAGIVTKGETVIIPISSETRIVKDALALSEIFKDAVVKVEENIPKFKLPQFSLKSINFNKLFSFAKIEQTKLSEFIPIPGKNDFNFEILMFILISLAYVFGFFYLEGSFLNVTGSTILENQGITNYFPILVGIVNLALILLIYFDLRNGKKLRGEK